MQARGRYWVYVWKLLTSFEIPPPGDSIQVQGPWAALAGISAKQLSEHPRFLTIHPQGADTYVHTTWAS